VPYAQKEETKMSENLFEQKLQELETKIETVVTIKVLTEIRQMIDARLAELTQPPQPK
jgi:hypothetical protein